MGQVAWKSSVVVSTEWERLGKEWRQLFKVQGRQKEVPYLGLCPSQIEEFFLPHAVLAWQFPRGSEEDHEYARQSLAAIRMSKCEGNWY